MNLGRALSLLIGLVATVAGAAVVWAIVGGGVREWESGAFIASAQAVVMVAVGVACGATAMVLSWRVLVGPPIEHLEWTLTFAGAAARSATVGELLAPLEALGYSLEAHYVDDAGRRLKGAGRAEPLAGRPLEVLGRAGDRRRGRVILRIPSSREDSESALGFVDVYAVLDGRCDELGRFLIAAIGRLFPDATYRPLHSGLTNEPAASLWALLPERPEHLDDRA